MGGGLHDPRDCRPRKRNTREVLTSCILRNSLMHKDGRKVDDWLVPRSTTWKVGCT